MLYTDVNVDAGWTTTEYSTEPWVVRPSFALIDGFDLRMVQVDWMHTWSLGVARDLLGSAIKLMCKDKSFYAGSSIGKRLKEFYRDLKIYVKATGKTLALKRLRKQTLCWSRGCPELHCKAADAAVILSFLRSSAKSLAARMLLWPLWHVTDTNTTSKFDQNFIIWSTCSETDDRAEDLQDGTIAIWMRTILSTAYACCAQLVIGRLRNTCFAEMLCR